MALYPHLELSKEDNEKFAKSISKLPLSAVLDKVTVTESLGSGNQYQQARTYKIRLDFYPAEEYCQEYAIKVRDVAEALEKKFCPRISKTIEQDLKKKKENLSLSTASAAKSAAVPTIGESAGTIEQARASGEAEAALQEGGVDDDESDDGQDEDDATYAKNRRRREDSVEFDAPDEDERAIAENLEREESEDETYGGSPKPPRAPSEQPDNEVVAEEEPLVSQQDASDVRQERILSDGKCKNVYGFKVSTITFCALNRKLLTRKSLMI
jgi:hypothetical protein